MLACLLTDGRSTILKSVHIPKLVEVYVENYNIWDAYKADLSHEERERAESFLANMKNPIPVHDHVLIEEMSWMQVRDAVKNGKTTVIIPTGGVEQHGPWMATGKHNFVLRLLISEVARDLGDALVAPIEPFVPEGSIDPPTEQMLFSGTISITEETFEALLGDIASSFKVHGFKHIVLVGDHGPNATGLKAVADRLNVQWKSQGTTVHFIPEYLQSYWDAFDILSKYGVNIEGNPDHEDFQFAALLTLIDPALLHWRDRVDQGAVTVTGCSILPEERTLRIAREIVDFRVSKTIQAINEARRRVGS
jgi:creatinine amidohydrolase